jgi:hypothetical protein
MGLIAIRLGSRAPRDCPASARTNQRGRASGRTDIERPSGGTRPVQHPLQQRQAGLVGPVNHHSLFSESPASTRMTPRAGGAQHHLVADHAHVAGGGGQQGQAGTVTDRHDKQQAPSLPRAVPAGGRHRSKCEETRLPVADSGAVAGCWGHGVAGCLAAPLNPMLPNVEACAYGRVGTIDVRRAPLTSP